MTKKCCFFALLFLLCALPVTSVAQVVMTQQELTQLELNLQEARSLIEFYKQSSTAQRQDLQRLSESLQKAGELLKASQDDLAKAIERSRELESSLMTANQSFELYAKEMKNKVRVAKAQRNIWFVCAVGVGAAYIVK